MIGSAILLRLPQVDFRRAMKALAGSRILQDVPAQRRYELISYVLMRVRDERQLPDPWSEWFAFADRFPAAPASDYRDLLEDDARRG